MKIHQFLNGYKEFQGIEKKIKFLQYLIDNYLKLCREKQLVFKNFKGETIKFSWDATIKLLNVASGMSDFWQTVQYAMGEGEITATEFNGGLQMSCGGKFSWYPGGKECYSIIEKEYEVCINE